MATSRAYVRAPKRPSWQQRSKNGVDGGFCLDFAAIERYLAMKRTILSTSSVVVSQNYNEANKIQATNDETHSPTLLPPTLPFRIFRPNKYMEIAFDTRTRTPIYVMERLEGLSSDDPPVKRRARFHEEATLPEEFRSRNGYFRGSGYDRGHLAPAADFRHLPDIIKDTYSLCNTVPQDQVMNRRGWAQLEAFVRRVAEREWNDGKGITFVITGPLWLPSSVSKNNPNVFHYSYQGIGSPPSLISVPTHLFKIVAVIRNDSIDKFAAFVMPNSEVKGDRVDLSHYIVRLSDLEAVVGMHFFPGMQDFRQQADVLTESLLALLDKTSSQLPLLLTDGSSQWKTGRDVQRRNVDDLRHLCEGGKCQ